MNDNNEPEHGPNPWMKSLLDLGRYFCGAGAGGLDVWRRA